MSADDHRAALRRAETAVTGLRAVRGDRWYPRFHIAAAGGWINDPNGLCYFGGRYHVFFQHHPFGSAWGPMHWGHVSSADLVTWRREPIALAPSLEADRDGVFSGSAVVDDDGNLVVFYTGHRWRNGVDETDGNLQVQCMAVSRNGVDFDKRGVVVTGPAELPHFRDPKVWRTGDRYFMVFGACSATRRGEVWLYHSADLAHWEFDRVLYQDPDPGVYMLECPDLFALGEHWVLTYCPMGAEPDGYLFRNGHNAGYVVGDWAPGSDFRPLTGYQVGDWGAEYYAPQSFSAPDGRQLSFAWMGQFDYRIVTADDGWCGQLTIPRELSLGPDLRLRSRPAAELTALRRNSVDHGAFELGRNEDRVLLSRGGECCEIELTVDLRAGTAERIGLAVNHTPGGHETLVAYDDLARRVLLDRRSTGFGERGYRSAPLDTDELRLRVFVDRGSVEVFIGDGAATLSSITQPADGPRSVQLYCESGTAAVTGLVVHRLRSGWEQD